jgi:hypothetical protein
MRICAQGKNIPATTLFTVPMPEVSFVLVSSVKNFTNCPALRKWPHSHILWSSERPKTLHRPTEYSRMAVDGSYLSFVVGGYAGGKVSEESMGWMP